MVCPNCNSENTQRLEVVFNHGTSLVNTTSKTNIRPTLGLFPTASAKTQTSGISMSNSAQRASPPAKHQYKTPTIAILVGIGIIAILNSFGVVAILIGLALIGTFGWVLYVGVNYNTNTWPGQYQQWLKSWACNKCGNIYSEN